jgi:hypothetical protein
MGLLDYGLNTMWMASCRQEAHHFSNACGDVAATQSRLLLSDLKANAECDFGKKHGFASLKKVQDFQSAVAPASYQDLKPWLDRAWNGETDVLTSHPIQIFEPTSGTSSGTKWIPYTAPLRTAFQRAVAAWIYDLMRRRPGVRKGPAYWSISPNMSTGPSFSPGGIPVGFDDDTAYLTALQRAAVRKLLVAPTGLRLVRDMEFFRYCTLFHMLRSADLSLISVWSPTFLMGLLERLSEWLPMICRSLNLGVLHHPDGITDSGDQDLWPGARPDPGRASRLESAFRKGLSAQGLANAWPGLSVISCWADGASAPRVKPLYDLFPGVFIQPKGLLSTEGVISIPFEEGDGSVLAVRSHFMEFESVEESPEGWIADGRIYLMHELEKGKKYRVLLTNGGGLYRYHSGDVLEVTGMYRECPRIRFLGRFGNISDQVGEKLNGVHVARVVMAMIHACGIETSFVKMMFRSRGRRKGYCLLIQSVAPLEVLHRLLPAIETGLRQNPYYAQAVELEQLDPLSLVILDPGHGSAQRHWEGFLCSQGFRLGDLKGEVLTRMPMDEAYWQDWIIQSEIADHPLSG